jgi:putative transposase
MKFGEAFSDQIRQRAPVRGDKWHLDEVVISIAGELYWLWRAVDQNGFVLDVAVQRRRDSGTARRLMTKLLKAARMPPRVMITDKLRSYAAARVEDGPSPRASPAQRTEQSGRELSPADEATGADYEALQISSTGATVLVGSRQIANIFHVPYPESTTAVDRRAARETAFAGGREITKTSAIV